MKKYSKYGQYLFILPLVLVLLLIVAYPFFSNVIYSFQEYKLINPNRSFVGLYNYKEILLSDEFTSLLGRTFTWTFSNIIIVIILGMSVGLLLDCDFKGKMILQSVILIPWVIPDTVTGYTFQWMMSADYGILNHILKSLHLINGEFSWFREGNMAMAAVVLANTWRAFPFFAVMIYAKKKSMPQDWKEAAMIDGANSFQIFRHITLAYLMPVIKRITFLIFIWSYNSFGIIYTMTGGGPLESTTTFPIYIQKKAFQQFDFGLTSAMSIITMLCMLVILFGAKTLPKCVNKLLGLSTGEEN